MINICQYTKHCYGPNQSSLSGRGCMSFIRNRFISSLVLDSQNSKKLSELQGKRPRTLRQVAHGNYYLVLRVAVSKQYEYDIALELTDAFCLL